MFQAAFGNFSNIGNITNYGEDMWLVYLIYLAMALLLQLVMLNMIIAIMGDTYDQVMQIQKEERLKAKCRLISHNEFIFARYRLFKDFRYIIIASLDKVNSGGDNWEGKINTMINHMDQKFNETQERSANGYKQISHNERALLNVIRNQDHKINDINSKLAYHYESLILSI